MVGMVRVFVVGVVAVVIIAVGVVVASLSSRLSSWSLRRSRSRHRRVVVAVVASRGSSPLSSRRLCHRCRRHCRGSGRLRRFLAVTSSLLVLSPRGCHRHGCRRGRRLVAVVVVAVVTLSWSRSLWSSPHRCGRRVAVPAMAMVVAHGPLIVVEVAVYKLHLVLVESPGGGGGRGRGQGRTPASLSSS